MKVYCYDEKTKEYINFSYETPFLPANATQKEPPAKKKNKIQVWDGTKWKQEKDYRGQRYWYAPSDSRFTFEGEVMTTIGDLPENTTTSKPYKETDLETMNNIQKEINECVKWLNDHDYIGTKLSTLRGKTHEYQNEIKQMQEYSDRYANLKLELEEIKNKLYNK